LLDVKNVSFRYNKKIDRYVLKNLSTKFETGFVYVIAGSSGAGKTTLLSLLAALDYCTEGEILYNGVDLKKINSDKYRATHIGFVFQQFNLLNNHNAIENVVIGMEISGVKVDNKTTQAKSVLMGMGITEDKHNRKVVELSGGEQQRVAISRAIAHNPSIILADEPTGNLDEENQNNIIKILKKLAYESGKCVIISSHSKDVINEADCVINL